MAVTGDVLRFTDVRREHSTGAGHVAALAGVTLRIARGELVAVVGPSGSGKSTFLAVAGTLDRATAGRVEVLGHDVSQLGDADLAGVRAHGIGFVFQQFHLDPHRDALGNVADGLLYTGMPRRRRRAAAAEALARVGLASRSGHHPRQLSGGERQRVAVARAVAGGPALLLADEPTGNLDSRSGEAVVESLLRLHDEGTTLVVVTHDTTLARSFARRVGFRDGLAVTDSGRPTGTGAAA